MSKTGTAVIKLNTEKHKLLAGESVSRLMTSTTADHLLMPVVAGMSVVYLAVLILPMYSIVQTSGIAKVLQAVWLEDNTSAIKLSFTTTSLSMLFVFLFGTAIAFFMNEIRNKFISRLLDMFISLPTVMPPAVAGIGLLLCLGRSGIIGSHLAGMGIEIVFTPLAVIAAQFFVSAGFYVQILKAGLDGVSTELFEASYTLGAGKVETFVRVVLPMLKKTVVSGLVVAWTRALGEFGATIMFAGNVLGSTRTVPLQVYTLMQTDITAAAAISMLLLFISSIMLFAVKLLCRE